MDASALSRLSPQQRAILARVHAGDSSKAIGRALGLSPAYVDNQVMSARRILGARSRIEAANLLITLEKATDLQIVDQPPRVAPGDGGGETVAQPSTGRRWPFPTTGRRYNDLTIRERLLWVLGIAFLSILIVGFLVDSLERLGRMI